MVADFVASDVGRQFHPVSVVTSSSWFHTVQFGLLPSTSFLCLIDSKPKFKTPQLDPVELLLVDIERIEALGKNENCFDYAVGCILISLVLSIQNLRF